MSAAAFRRGHRPSPSSGASSSQINAGLARDLALNHAYNELGKELFSSSLKAVGNYSLGRVIGEGSFGSVRLGLHRLTNTRVAIKQISRSAAPSSLTREIHHHRRLHHVHVCQLLEIVATESSIYLISELCSGGELFDYLVENGRLSEQETRRIIGQLLCGLGYCHQMGVVHRDLKLENILLNEFCDVKLADFGFGREFDKNRLMDTFCGTTGYAAPEMLSGQKYRAEEIDIWSVGVILYTLLTGSLPFDDDDEQVMKQKIVTLDYDLPSWLPEEPRDLVSKILILDPKGRPSIRDILAHPWFSKPLLPNGSSLLVASAMTPTLSQSGQPPIPEEEVEGAPDKHGRDPSAISYDSSLSNLADETTVSNDSRPEKSLYHDGRQTQVKSSPRHSIDESDGRVPRSPLISRSTSFSGHSPAMTPHSRTPSRTKRRSISSLHTLSERAPPQDSAPTIDYLSMLEQHQSAQFESSSDQKLLDAMDALGLDVGQVKHSVTEEACDATGAIWWMLKRKREVKAAEEATLRTARASNDSRRTTANVMPPSASIPSIGLVESDSNYSFPARRRPRSNSALASSPSTPASPSVTPALLGSPSVPNLSQFKDAPEAEILERKPSPAPLAGLGLGRPEALQQPERPSPNPSPSKPRSASISILQRATSAITGSSNGPGGERGRESQEQTGRATPLGIFFGRKGSGSLGTELQNTSPTGADVEKRPSSREGANAEELEVLGDSPTMPESALPTPSSSHATMGTSPASSAATQPQLSKTAANTTKHRSRGSGLFSTFKFFFNEDRKRRKRNTAADLQNFEGSSVAKFRVATAVNPGSRYAESPNRQPLDSKSSSTSGLRIDTDPVQPSRRSSVSSAHRPAAQRPVRRQSNASRRSVGDHMSTPDKSRPTSVVSADGIAPLMGQNGQNSHQRNRSRRHKRTGSQSSTTSRNSKGSEGHVTSFRRAPTTTTQVRRIERGRPSNRRRDSTSSSIRSFSSRPSSFSEEEAERVPSPMVHKDEPVIEEENELDETAQQGLERERALQRLSGSNTPSDMATHGRVQPSGQNTSERQHPMFAAHKSTSIFNSPAQSQQHRSSTQPKQKLRDVFAASRSHKADDEWVDEEDALEGFSGGFGQAAPSKTNVVLPQESSVGLLGASRYAGVNEAATATESVSGNKRQNPGFKGMATTVEEEEEEE